MLITHEDSDVGYHLARELLATGNRVVVTARNSLSLSRTLLDQSASDVVAIAADIDHPRQWFRLVKSAQTQLGAITKVVDGREHTLEQNAFPRCPQRCPMFARHAAGHRCQWLSKPAAYTSRTRMKPIALTFRILSAICAVNLPLLSMGIAHAEQRSVADVVRTATTFDGWQMTLSMTEARINAVPNMAAAALSSEGYLSARVTLTIDGEGRAPVTSGQLVVGAQLGCQVDLSEGLDLGVDFDTDLFDDDTIIGVGPDFGSTLHSGGITAVGLGTKELKGRVATIFILDAHVDVDQCGGAVTVRLFASAQMSTDASDDSLNAYGEVLPL